MSNDFYTFLIIPKKEKPVKKISISSISVKVISAFVAMILLLTAYTYYDYLRIKGEKIELTRLRQRTKEQKMLIDNLARKVGSFALKMDELMQLDREVRVLATNVDTRTGRQMLGMGGSLNVANRVSSRIETDQKTLMARIEKNLDQLQKDAHEQRQSYHELINYLKERKSIHQATPSIWPVRGWVTSEFGIRGSPFGSAEEFHKGIDIATRMGTDIISPADGVVEESVYDRELGNMVRINHGYGMATLYGHLMESVVHAGSLVKRGAVIGYVGNTGRSTGSHLHYSVFLNDVPVNPRNYLD